MLAATTLAEALGAYVAPSFVAPRPRGARVALRAEPEVVDVEAAALVKLEEDIEAKILEAEKAKDQSSMTRLSRLLVLTRSSAAATAWQTTKAPKCRLEVSERCARS